MEIGASRTAGKDGSPFGGNVAGDRDTGEKQMLQAPQAFFYFPCLGMFYWIGEAVHKRLVIEKYFHADINSVLAMSLIDRWVPLQKESIIMWL